MVELGKQYLSSLGANKILLMIIKGQGLDLEKNPLNEKEQISLLYSLYKDDPKVEIYNKFPKSSFIKDIADHIYSTGNIVVGWLAGSDRMKDYQRELKYFEPTKYIQDHEYSPFLKDQYNSSKVEMIETPRIFSGTEARVLAKENIDFEKWVSIIRSKKYFKRSY